MSRRGWVLFALMSVIWGVPYLFIRVAVEQLSPVAVVAVRVGGATLVLVPLCLLRGWGTTVTPVLRRWRPLVAFTVLEIAVPWLLLTRAERGVTSSLAGILVAATALTAAVLARVVSGRTRGTPGRSAPAEEDRLDRWRVVGLVVGFGGVVVLLGLDLGQVSAGPLVEIAGVVLGYAVAPLILSRWLSDLPGLGVVTASVGLAALGYVPAALLGPPVDWAGLDLRAVGALAGLALVCTALAFVLFFQLVAEAGPARAVVITFVNPAVALLLGVAVLGEPVTVGMAVGFPLILAGCVLGARRRAPTTAPPPADPTRASVPPASVTPAPVSAGDALAEPCP